MIFLPEHCQLILVGLKTKTRRLLEEDDRVRYHGCGCGAHMVPLSADDPITAVYRRGRLLWHIGRHYAIQPGRGQTAWGHFRLITISRREYLQDISPADCVAEGVPIITWANAGGDAEHYRHYRNAYAAVWDRINRKPSTRWADNPEVWPLTFEVVR